MLITNKLGLAFFEKSFNHLLNTCIYRQITQNYTI